MIYEFGNQGYVSYINGIKRQGLGRQKYHVKEGDVVISTHQYAYNVVPKEDGCLHCSAHEGGGCYFAFTELDCKKNNVILKEDASKSNRTCKSKSKDPSTEIYTWEANDREVCVKGSLGFEKYLEFSQFLEEFEIGDEEMNQNNYWYGIKPYSEEDLKNSIESWSKIEWTREDFISHLIQDVLYIGLIHYEDEAMEIAEYLNQANDNLLYAVADFIDELMNK